MNVELYIADKQVDLDETSLVQLNYTAEDLNNPTIVKNSFSRQVTLKGTPANNKVFGALFELARTTTITDSVDSQSGTYFNPMVKTPFVLYRNGEVIEQGYIRMDGIERKGGAVAYKVTLFGGLGEFFYNLSYSEEGDKMSLADLDYLGTANKETELTFDITTSAVQSAWAMLDNASPTGIWSVLNFAPAYNGIPSDFSADKGVFQPSVAGFPTTVTDSSTGTDYTTNAGWALVDMGKDYNEWQTKDLRSYLQRPVISMQKVIAACCNPDNNGGYTVNLDSSFFNANNPYYTKTWVTLPVLQGLSVRDRVEVYDMEASEDDLNWNTGATTTLTTSFYDQSSESEVDVQLEDGRVSGSIRFRPYCTLVGQSALENWTVLTMLTKRITITMKCMNGTSVVYSKSVTITGVENTSTGYLEASWWYRAPSTSPTGAPIGGYAYWDSYIDFEFEDLVLTHIVFEVTPSSNWDNPPTLVLRNDTSTSYEVDSMWLNTVSGEVTLSTTSVVRSGQQITKRMLLSTENTPADYLISYAKTFGLQFIYDKHTKEITIATRNTLYDGTEIDLSDRIDYSQPVKITPFVFDSKWYDLGFEYDEGAYANYYKMMNGRTYGLQRINTGYEFNREAKNLLDGNAFMGAVEVMGRSPYFVNIKSTANKPIPSPFIDGGMSYNLYSSDGEEYEVPVGVKSTDDITYWNEAQMTYDAVPKMQFEDDGGEGIEQRDVLVFYRGKSSNAAYAQFRLSDDNGAMSALNDGEPCWMLNGGTSVTSIPIFGRYLYNDAGTTPFGSTIVHSLDFGTPVELDIPGVTVSDGSTISDKAWMAYLADRYDLDTKVVTCHVNWSGIRIEASLLRKFYYFEGCWWVLNAIKNYDATKDNPIVECEFVKVKNKDNYTTGQSWQ